MESEQIHSGRPDMPRPMPPVENKKSGQTEMGTAEDKAAAEAHLPTDPNLVFDEVPKEKKGILQRMGEALSRGNRGTWQ